MHLLAAAQHGAVAASSLCLTSPSIIVGLPNPCSRTTAALSAHLSCRNCSRPSSSSRAPPRLVQRAGLRVLDSSFLSFSLTHTLKGNGHARSIGIIRSLASRKDRREMESGTGPAPDIKSLRVGFSKRFPGEDTSEFLYEQDSDDDGDDGVQLRSFRGGESGRAQSSSGARYGQNPRIGNRSGGFPGSRGRPELRPETAGYERRKSQGSDKTLGGSSSRGSLGNDRRQGAKTQEFRSPGGSWKQRDGEVGGFRNSRETRVNSGASRNSQEGDRNVANEGNTPPQQPSDVAGKVRRGRLPYGGGEWSKDTPIFDDEDKKKKKPVLEAVNFSSPMNKDPHVAILGGGMSGLVCALTLEEHGIQSTVFDTGKHGLGGRMATRYVEEQDGAKLIFDHGAQFFTVTDARFQKLVDKWISDGAVKEWKGHVGTLQAGGQYAELPHAKRYIGTNGMRDLADRMLSQAQQINVKRPCWISAMEEVNGRWKLTENRKPQGEFDAVVIAHNGKCANRLLSTARVPHIARQMKRLELSSIWALLAAFEEPLSLPSGEILDGAFVDGVDSLSWMGNNTSKLGLLKDKTCQCWTFFSTAAYGKRNKVPQESIPAVRAQKVKYEMLHGVETALGLPKDSLPTPMYTRLQLWGAALPRNTPDVPCIFDSHGRVGICGDWLLGSSLEAAALSGMALADHISKYRDHGEQSEDDFSIGLQESCNSLEGHDIGQFPGTEELPKESLREVLAIA